MEETFEQKVMRNVQGQFAIFKTPEVIGDKTGIPNLEWEESDNVDKFFVFAKNMGAKVIYITEGEETDDITGQVKTTMLQIGFLHQGIMHHINFAEDDEDNEDDDELVEIEEDDEEEVEYETPSQPENNSGFIQPNF